MAADKAHRALGTDRQVELLVDSIKRSGKFDGYNVVVHEPLPQERARIYANLLDKTVGTGGREILSSAPCYAEFHISYLTVFRTTLSELPGGFRSASTTTSAPRGSAPCGFSAAIATRGLTNPACLRVL